MRPSSAVEEPPGKTWQADSARPTGKAEIDPCLTESRKASGDLLRIDGSATIESQLSDRSHKVSLGIHASRRCPLSTVAKVGTL